MQKFTVGRLTKSYALERVLQKALIETLPADWFQAICQDALTCIVIGLMVMLCLMTLMEMRSWDSCLTFSLFPQLLQVGVYNLCQPGLCLGIHDLRRPLVSFLSHVTALN